MSVNPNAVVWPHYAAANVNATKASDSKVLGQDEFLKILIAQLQNQDPMQPMQDRDFIAQMAQFSSVEQMMSMSNEIQLLRQSMGISSDLIGKSVSWYEMNSSGTGIVTASGVVEAITFNEGKQFAIVGSKMISIDELVKIWVGEEPNIGEDIVDDPVEDPVDDPVEGIDEGSDDGGETP